MEQEIKQLNDISRKFWQFTIAAMSIVLLVLIGGIIVILIQGGHSISGREVLQDAAFPFVIFIPVWLLFLKKREGPTPRQEKIMKLMITAILISLVANIFVFWLL